MFLTVQGLALIAPGGLVPATLETVRRGEEGGQPQYGRRLGFLGCVSAHTKDHALRPDSSLPSIPEAALQRVWALQGPEQPVLFPQGNRVPSRARLRAQTCCDGGSVFRSRGLSTSSSAKMRPEYGRSSSLRGQPPQPREASLPLPIQGLCHPPLTIGGREVDGHCEVDLGPRGRRTAGSYLDRGGAEGGGAGLEGGEPGSTARCCLVCSLSIWKTGI